MSMEVDGILVAAHELKAPLAVLRQLALSLDGLNLQNELVESELSQIRSEMVQVSERAIKQVNDLAKIRRLEDGLFKMEPVAVREVCDAVSREIAHLYVKEGREFRTEYHNRERLVTANRELLFSVVYNFATNALHYAERGSRAVLKIGEKKGKMFWCATTGQVCRRRFGEKCKVDWLRSRQRSRCDQVRRGWGFISRRNFRNIWKRKSERCGIATERVSLLNCQFLNKRVCSDDFRD